MVLPIAREILIPSTSSTSEPSQKIAAMTLWLGANDAGVSHLSSVRGLFLVRRV